MQGMAGSDWAVTWMPPQERGGAWTHAPTGHSERGGWPMRGTLTGGPRPRAGVPSLGGGAACSVGGRMLSYPFPTRLPLFWMFEGCTRMAFGLSFSLSPPPRDFRLPKIGSAGLSDVVQKKWTAPSPKTTIPGGWPTLGSHGMPHVHWDWNGCCALATAQHGLPVVPPPLGEGLSAHRTSLTNSPSRPTHRRGGGTLGQ